MTAILHAMKKKTFQVELAEAGEKLYLYLYQQLGEKRAKREIRRAIEHGQVTVNRNLELRASYRCQRGEKVAIDLDYFSRPTPLLGFTKERVLYEDDYLIAYDKPAGVACEEKELLALVRCGYPQAELCHRLDAETSGVILLAREKRYLDPILALFR